jgi:hypothetical protein
MSRRPWRSRDNELEIDVAMMVNEGIHHGVVYREDIKSIGRKKETAFTSPEDDEIVYRKDIKSIGKKKDRAAAKQMEKKVC